MKLNKILTIALSTTLIIGGIFNANAQTISIIPEPYQMTKGTGTYTLPKSIAMNAPSSAKVVSDQIAAKLKTTTGRVVNLTKNKSNIDLQIINDANLGTEGYTLDINEKGIQIKANANAGLFFGWQTVMQLLPSAVYSNTLQAYTNWTLPYVSIIDKPRFGWRGLMLDVSRHFFNKADVLTFIDDMARYKYNRFHWHLTDDQGWRIEIKSLPKLTSVGAWRPERKGKWMNTTPPAKDEPKTYGGFYTQEDIKEVVAYAKARFIEVIPEIDIPGHSLAMNAAYPFLSTTPNYPFQVNAGEEFMDWEGFNGHVAAKIDNSLDPSNETVYEYLDKIFGEIAPYFLLNTYIWVEMKIQKTIGRNRPMFKRL
jgi:hexosaminidase